MSVQIVTAMLLSIYQNKIIGNVYVATKRLESHRIVKIVAILCHVDCPHSLCPIIVQRIINTFVRDVLQKQEKAKNISTIHLNEKRRGADYTDRTPPIISPR